MEVAERTSSIKLRTGWDTVERIKKIQSRHLDDTHVHYTEKDVNMLFVTDTRKCGHALCAVMCTQVSFTVRNDVNNYLLASLVVTYRVLLHASVEMPLRTTVART